MKNLFKKIENSLPDYSNWKFWFIAALCFKALFFILKYYDQNTSNSHYLGTFAEDGGDTFSYIEPIENLLKYGAYFDDYRMPGYGFIYFIFRCLMSQTMALNLLAILQVILSALSTYVIALIAIRLFKRTTVFYVAFFAYAISTFVSIYDNALGTESFCTSSIIFSFYFLLSHKKRSLVLSGLFLCWSVFLRPVMAPLLIIFGIYILLLDCKDLFKQPKYYFKRLVIFLIPFILIDGTWVCRNYQKYHEIIPLTRTVFYPGTEGSYLGSLFEFMYSFGGSIVWWEPGSDITYFMKPPEFIRKKVETKLPSNIYTSKFNADSLILLKKYIQQIENANTSEKDKLNLTQIVKCKLEVYTKSIKKEKPFLYYIGSRIKLMKTFLIHSGTYNLFSLPSNDLNMIQLLVKIFYSIFYLVVILFGFIGIALLLLKERKNSAYFLLFSTSIYLVLAYPIIFKLDQSRYFVPAYPFFVLTAIYSLSYFISKLNINAKTIGNTPNL